ncbi:hypothetical protein COLO4_11630 [Corchorus olitorius]|uniref:Uncharacterized protein n=1 Tax=Corchorus olitorius TaxID=93759 RepID=A0A1R3K3W4_9ROSI|nr:hypothetical protein COLO4_11630 [Corchorus olitorius]
MAPIGLASIPLVTSNMEIALESKNQAMGLASIARGLDRDS